MAIFDDDQCRDRPQAPICPPGGDGPGRWLCRSSSTIPSIASSSLRALNAVALATYIIVFMEGSTKMRWAGWFLPGQAEL